MNEPLTSNLVAELRQYGIEKLAENFPNRKDPLLISGPYIPLSDVRPLIERLTAERDHLSKVVDDTRAVSADVVRQLEAERDRLLKAIEGEPLQRTRRFLDMESEVMRLRAALERAASAMGGVTVFVASREQIKQPEGLAWWRGEINAAREALANVSA